MKPVIFTLFEQSELSQYLVKNLDIEPGKMHWHRFPDKETYIKIETDLTNRDVLIFASLNDPNYKILPLLFFAKTAKELGAKKVGLIAPYLSYLRQDKRFSAGEGVTSKYFAELISKYLDWLLTVDPHLHRYQHLNEIYTIPTIELHAADMIAKWLKAHITHPLLIGPDAESQQWVAEVAKDNQLPYLVLEKKRLSDNVVEIILPKITNFQHDTLVLIDDIISTGKTMLKTVIQLRERGVKKVICIGVHAVFADDAYQLLSETDIVDIVTCDTIPHKSNAINLGELIVHGLVTHNVVAGLERIQ